ncbi:MAG: hypothetical protein OEV42_15135, partial [Deltaproteobacteria bacterium]|nr:hypothetical protein [Deltaproteobacteria bacterium]
YYSFLNNYPGSTRSITKKRIVRTGSRGQGFEGIGFQGSRKYFKIIRYQYKPVSKSYSSGANPRLKVFSEIARGKRTC